MPSYKDNEKNTWYAKFYYTDWQGNKKQKLKRGFTTKREASAWERAFLDKQHANPDMTFKSLKELYFEDMSSRLRENTVKSKKNVVDTKILPYFENMSIEQIKPTTIRKWQSELLTKEFSPSYLKYVNAQLSAIFNFGVMYYDLKENPCKKAGSMGSTKTKDIDFWTLDEFKEFIKHPKDKYVMAFKVLYWTGMRVGEMMALLVSDIDFDNNIINIDKSHQRIKKKDIITDPKTPKSTRKITIPEFLTAELKNYVNSFYEMDENERLFDFSKQMLNKEITRVCEENKLKRITVHDIRHSHASLLIELGFSPLLIAERLGHDKVETTLNIYSHLYPNKHSEVAEKLQTLIK
jgi:integrase